MNSKKEMLYRWIAYDVAGISIGQILPKWLLCIRCLLFPIKFLSAYLRNVEGYQIMSNSWKINGVEYSDDFFKIISNNTKNKDIWYRFEKDEYDRITVVTKRETDIYKT